MEEDVRCPQCDQEARVEDIYKVFEEIAPIFDVKIRCECGHYYTQILEEGHLLVNGIPLYKFYSLKNQIKYS